MRINTETNEVLFRLSKYGKWKPLNVHQEFEDQAALIVYCLDRFDESEFIQIRIDGGSETTIKR